VCGEGRQNEKRFGNFLTNAFQVKSSSRNAAMISASDYPLLLQYGSKCLSSHLVLYFLFKKLLQSKKDVGNDFPWKNDPSLTAHRIVAFFVMCNWCYLGFKHLLNYDYNSDSDLAALTFVPAGYEIAQYAMGALLIWDIPVSLVGGSGPTDIMMHLHHAGMLLVTACVLGFVNGLSTSGDGIVGTHLAPLFLGVVELSSIPLQIVDLFHPKKSPHWNKYICDDSSTGLFKRLCFAVNEISRILFAILFLLVRGLYFPYAIATIAVPDFYAEGSLASWVLLILSVLFTLLQMYWATLVFGQVKKALSGSGGKSEDKRTGKEE